MTINKVIVMHMAKNILARQFEDMNDKERTEYLREHQDSRWNPGKAQLPRKKLRKRKK